MNQEGKQPEDLTSLERRLARLEKMIKGTGEEGLHEKLAKVGEARRAALKLDESEASKLIRRRIAAIAQKHGMIVEWTLRPVRTEETVACGCGCGCGCSCIA